MGFLSWLTGAPARISRALRRECALAAYYWNGAAGISAPVQNISRSGAYIHTTERWYVGTVLNLTLQYQPEGEADDDTKLPSITVPCKVVRHGPDGMGVTFMFENTKQEKAVRQFVECVPDRNASAALRDSNGQALIEFALMVPLIFLLIINGVNFGGFIYSWITISNAARAGAEYASMGSAYASYPSLATLSQITTLIQNETSSLPGASTTNPAVAICENQNGTAISYPPTNPTTSCSGTAPPNDPETITGVSGASLYTTVAIDVTYTYTPFVPAFSVAGFGIVSPPGTVHRRTVMRVLN